MIAWFVPSIYLLLYALLHSVLASQTFKTSVARYLPLTYYRLIYVLLSLILLLPLPFLPLPQGLLYRLPFPGIFYVPQAIGLLGFVWALQHTDLSEFLGWTQLKRRNAASSQTDENPVPVPPL